MCVRVCRTHSDLLHVSSAHFAAELPIKNDERAMLRLYTLPTTSAADARVYVTQDEMGPVSARHTAEVAESARARECYAVSREDSAHTYRNYGEKGRGREIVGSAIALHVVPKD